MTNSFYYFFSSTPQVLAAILALFGVFVIFKIRSIKHHLIGIGQSIIDEVERYRNKDGSKLILNEELQNESIIKDIKKAIIREDIVGLNRIIGLIKCNHFIVYWQRFNEVYDFCQNLINWTIVLSIFTSIVIIICLSTIPLGHFIINHTCIFYYLSFKLIISILCCFFGFIYILIRSLKEPDYSMFPNE